MKGMVGPLTSIVLFSFLACLIGCHKNGDPRGESIQVVEIAEIPQPEGFPEKNIVFFLPVPAGGLIDVAMRSLADIVDFNNPVVVINRPGKGQTIGLSEVILKSHDPHIVTAAGFSGLMIQPNMIDVSYSINDFRYIAFNHPPEPQVIISMAGSKYKTWQDVKKSLKSGHDVRFSAPNTEGLGRIAMYEIMLQEDIHPQFVPFLGSAEGFSALLSGLIDFYIIDASVAVPRINREQFIGLMILGPDRLSKIPEVPSAQELHVRNMEKFVGYTTIAVSKETPDEIVLWLKYKIDQAQQSEAYKKYLNRDVGTEKPLKYYTEDEITHMVYDSYEAIVHIMDTFGISVK